jgi:hypothetical protein
MRLATATRHPWVLLSGGSSHVLELLVPVNDLDAMLKAGGRWGVADPSKVAVHDGLDVSTALFVVGGQCRE